LEKKYRYPLLAGILIVLIGVIYEVGFIGIPPWDLPADLAPRYQQNLEIAKWIKVTGAAIGVSVFLWRAFRLIIGHQRQKGN
jgi:hypothetical protein